MNDLSSDYLSSDFKAQDSGNIVEYELWSKVQSEIEKQTIGLNVSNVIAGCMRSVSNF